MEMIAQWAVIVWFTESLAWAFLPVNWWPSEFRHRSMPILTRRIRPFYFIIANPRLSLFISAPMCSSSDDIQQERITCKFHPFVVQGTLLARKSSLLILIYSTRYGHITESWEWVDEGGLWGGGDIIQMMYQPGWFRERDPRWVAGANQSAGVGGISGGWSGAGCNLQ